jgi:hypothetical protein
MRQLVTIAWNAFMELVRQPVFLLLSTASASFNIFLAAVPYFGFGDDQKMVKDSVLAVTFLTGILGAVLSASASVAHEIRTGTALAVLAKPVGRFQFIIGKYLGLASAITLMTFINFVSVLLVSRMAYDAYGEADKIGTLIYGLFIALAYIAGGFTNYFLRRPFVADTVFYLTGALVLAFVAINLIDKEGNFQKFATGVDWRLVPATMLTGNDSDACDLHGCLSFGINVRLFVRSRQRLVAADHACHHAEPRALLDGGRAGDRQIDSVELCGQGLCLCSSVSGCGIEHGVDAISRS